MEDAIMEVDITVLMDAAVAHTSNFCINSKKINFAIPVFVLRVLSFAFILKDNYFKPLEQGPIYVVSFDFLIHKPSYY